MGNPADEPEQDSSVSRSAEEKCVVRNHLLLSIPASELRLLRPHLQACHFRQHEILHEPSQRLQFAYFPNSGLISLVVAMADGSTVEAGMVGREGMAGLSCAAGLTRCSLRLVVQIPGEGLKIRIGHLQAALKPASQFQMSVGRYAVIKGMQMAQTAACNRLHDARQRLARWLLTARDRVDMESLPVTHDFLATILGTDRPSVSLAAKLLQRKGIIEYKRGRISILSLRKWENSSCECYRVIQTLAKRLTDREKDCD
ncbi:MAG: Crp/Fnr family transcriptional regulator [Candidatus Acidiferrum sp.]